MVQNTAPNISNVIISPNPVFTGSTLTCSASASDPEDGALQPLYDWSVNGSPVGVGSTWTVSNVQASVGDSIVCTATAQDSQMLSTKSSTASVILSNSTPVVSSVQITCANGAYNDQTCECTASVSDPDEIVTPTYEWTGASGSIGLMSFGFGHNSHDAGDVLECTVTVVDAVGSQSQGADTITIDNRRPNASLCFDNTSHTDCYALMISFVKLVQMVIQMVNL